MTSYPPGEEKKSIERVWFSDISVVNVFITKGVFFHFQSPIRVAKMLEGLYKKDVSDGDEFCKQQKN